MKIFKTYNYIVIIGLLMVINLMSSGATAQSLNPLNYSGKMYVIKMESITTTRYVSFEDHSLLTTEFEMDPASWGLLGMAITFDFKKKIIRWHGSSIFGEDAQKSEELFSVISTKKYITDHKQWIAVISMKPSSKEKYYRYELVWPQYGYPYFQSMRNDGEKCEITRYTLSTESPAASWF